MADCPVPQPIYSFWPVPCMTGPTPPIYAEVFVKVFRGVSGFHGNLPCARGFTGIALREASNSGVVDAAQQQEVPTRWKSRDDSGFPVKLKDTLVDSGESPFEMAVHEENGRASKQRCARYPSHSRPLSFCATSKALFTRKSQRSRV